jgi:hypothetical protein
MQPKTFVGCFSYSDWLSQNMTTNAKLLPLIYPHAPNLIVLRVVIYFDFVAESLIRRKTDSIIRRKSGCTVCETSAISRSLHPDSHQIGSTVVEYSLQGSDSTTYTYFQCRDCGSIWEQQVDNIAGGRTRLRRLTGY